VILPEHLPPTFFDVPSVRRGEGSRLPELSLEAAERDQILRALQASGGKRIEAARLLGLSRRTLYRKLDRYGITR
jgi:transcriptional regulator of acetoin/glycerol metabolism